MLIRPLKIPGAFEITLQPRVDERGDFVRTFDTHIFSEHGLTTAWLQENEALSCSHGVVRGLHFQRPPHSETKLVRVVLGAVLDVFVDIRRSSPTYGKWDMVELSATNHKAVYVPKGCAHGYCTLTDSSIVLYKVDSCYAPAHEGGLRWNDELLNIPWPVKEAVISAKDAKLPSLDGFLSPFE